jgi:hypothetical protein
MGKWVLVGTAGAPSAAWLEFICPEPTEGLFGVLCPSFTQKLRHMGIFAVGSRETIPFAETSVGRCRKRKGRPLCEQKPTS